MRRPKLCGPAIETFINLIIVFENSVADDVSAEFGIGQRLDPEFAEGNENLTEPVIIRAGFDD